MTVIDNGVVKLEEFARLAPKIENHVHLDGSYDHEILYRIAKKHVDDLPEEITVPVLERKVPLRRIVRESKNLEEFA